MDVTIAKIISASITAFMLGMCFLLMLIGYHSIYPAHEWLIIFGAIMAAGIIHTDIL